MLSQNKQLIEFSGGGRDIHLFFVRRTVLEVEDFRLSLVAHLELPILHALYIIVNYYSHDYYFNYYLLLLLLLLLL